MLRQTPLIALMLILSGAAAPARVANAASSAVVISPGRVSLEAGATRQFTATVNGAALNAKWQATGGTITNTGLFTAGPTAGKYFVTADTIGNRAVKGTAAVTITSSRVLSQLVISAGADALMQPDQSAQFSAAGIWSDGSTSALAVNWTATGGAMTSAGFYIAGQRGKLPDLTARNGTITATASNPISGRRHRLDFSGQTCSRRS